MQIPNRNHKVYRSAIFLGVDGYTPPAKFRLGGLMLGVVIPLFAKSWLIAAIFWPILIVSYFTMKTALREDPHAISCYRAYQGQKDSYDPWVTERQRIGPYMRPRWFFGGYPI